MSGFFRNIPQPPEIEDTNSDVSLTSDTRGDKKDIGRLSFEESSSQFSSNYSSNFPTAPPKVGHESKQMRDLMMSGFSEYSANVNQVAQPVSVKVVNQPVVPTVNRSASIKLQTAAGSSTKMEPDMSYNTSVESSVPPRSSRRPQSEIVDKRGLEQDIQNYANKTKAPTRGHKVSVSISDELDKLMERANSIKLKTYTFDELPRSDQSSHLTEASEKSEGSEKVLGHKSQGSDNSNSIGDYQPPPGLASSNQGSSESFKTASLHSVESEEPLALPKRTSLPPRPSVENLARARQVSSQVEKEVQNSSEDLHNLDQTGAELGSVRSNSDAVDTLEKRKLQISMSSKDRIHQTLPQPPVTSDDESHYSDDALLLGLNSINRGSLASGRSSQLSRGLGIGTTAAVAGVGAAGVGAAAAVGKTSSRGSSNLAPAVPEKYTPNISGVEHQLDTTHNAEIPADYSPKGNYVDPEIYAGADRTLGDTSHSFGTEAEPYTSLSDYPESRLGSSPQEKIQRDEAHAESDAGASRNVATFGAAAAAAAVATPVAQQYHDQNTFAPPTAYNEGSYKPSPDVMRPKQVFDDENTSSNYNDEDDDNYQYKPSFPPQTGGSGAFADKELPPVDIAQDASSNAYQTPQVSEKEAKRNSSQFKTPDISTVPEPEAPLPFHNSDQDKDIGLDDQYYDIDEPVVVEKPARGKSVKESTKHPRKMKRKSSKMKARDLSGLKPFSYHTLINLLESINGTIIGEEFNQLDLPVKEKQLIEKIVDQLSRLTLDMVLDEQRYAIGIDRLERALRVLEGFM